MAKISTRKGSDMVSSQAMVEIKCNPGDKLQINVWWHMHILGNGKMSVYWNDQKLNLKLKKRNWSACKTNLCTTLSVKRVRARVRAQACGLTCPCAGKTEPWNCAAVATLTPRSEGSNIIRIVFEPDVPGKPAEATVFFEIKNIKSSFTTCT